MDSIDLYYRLKKNHQFLKKVFHQIFRVDLPHHINLSEWMKIRLIFNIYAYRQIWEQQKSEKPLAWLKSTKIGGAGGSYEPPPGSIFCLLTHFLPPLNPELLQSIAEGVPGDI